MSGIRRADRLFEIIQVLRRKHRARAADLASHLGVSERSIYRDIRDLVARGVPIEGEAGVGYIMRPGFDLPPLMFNKTEIEALLMGARIVQSWADPELAASATTAMDKIRAVSPEHVKKQLDFVRLWAPAEHAREPIDIDQAALRQAIRNLQNPLHLPRSQDGPIDRARCSTVNHGLLRPDLAVGGMVRAPR